jgi:hypothetical protein
VHTVSALFLRNWFGEYGHAYGGFGISLALAAFTGIIGSFWVWIAAVMGVYWERKAGPAAVARMEKPVSRHQRVIAGSDGYTEDGAGHPCRQLRADSPPVSKLRVSDGSSAGHVNLLADRRSGIPEAEEGPGGRRALSSAAMAHRTGELA